MLIVFEFLRYMPVVMPVKCTWAILNALKCDKSIQTTTVYVTLPRYVHGSDAGMESKTVDNYTEPVRVA